MICNVFCVYYISFYLVFLKYIFYSFSASGMEPMCLSNFMTSSMQLAKECLSQRLTDDQGESFPPLDGLEKFAETIETGNFLPIHDLKLDLVCFFSQIKSVSIVEKMLFCFVGIQNQSNVSAIYGFPSSLC